MDNALKKVKQVYLHICSMFHNELRQRKDVTYSNICVPAELGEDSKDFITHIHIGRAKN